MLDPHAIQEKINDLSIEFRIALQDLQIKLLDGEDYDLELHRCQKICSEIAELEEYYDAFKQIKGDE